MPKLNDPKLRDVVLRAFLEEETCRGFVTWKPSAVERLARDFPGYLPQLVNSLVLAHLRNGGEIKFAVETRDEYLQCGFHYDVLLPGHKGKEIYVETVILNDGANDPIDLQVHVVSCHRNVK
jgi:hypothetical protein